MNDFGAVKLRCVNAPCRSSKFDRPDAGSGALVPATVCTVFSQDRHSGWSILT